TRVGPLRLEDAVPWAVIQEGEPSVLAAAVRPADQAVTHLPAVDLSSDISRRLAHGQAVPLTELGPLAAPDAPAPCRVYSTGRFLGVGELSSRGLRPLRLVYADRSQPRPVSP